MSMNRYLTIALAVALAIAIYQGIRISQLKSASPEGVSVAMLEACAIRAADERKTNTLDDAVLAPRLLDDGDEIRQYLEDFPRDQYSIHHIESGPTPVKFLLDESADAIKDELKAGRVWEPHVVDMIIKYADLGTTVLDIGAHIGAHSVYMSRVVGPTGRVYGFEPQRKVYREYVENMKLNGAGNVVPLRFAAGDTPGVIEMNPTTDGNEGGTSVGSGGDRAELRTVDSFGFRNVSLIKIDVEHLEDAVLEGARQTIERERPVMLIEIQGGYLPESAPQEILDRKAATIQKIESMGYAVLRFAPYDYLAVPR